MYTYMIPRWRSYCQENMTGNPLTGIEYTLRSGLDSKKKIVTQYIALFFYLWKESLNTDGEQFPPISTNGTITPYLIDN
jgi:hypothetical protein